MFVSCVSGVVWFLRGWGVIEGVGVGVIDEYRFSC